MDERRDNRNRVLIRGEAQRKDGRYSYSYTGIDGSRKFIYSHRLLPNDPIPAGKKEEKSLRELEAEIEGCERDGIVPYGGGIDVITLVKRYLKLKRGVKKSTRAVYGTVLNWLEENPFGKKRIDRITTSDAKILLMKLQEEEGKGYSTIHNIRGVLRPAFQVAVDDDLIRKNPFDFNLGDVVINDMTKREAITKEDMDEFLDFVRTDPHFKVYYDGMFILFHTGMRISEFVGLTYKDIDMDKEEISINHQLMRLGSVGYYIESTKTSSGTRVLPMIDEVKECFYRVLERRRNRKKKKEVLINGYGGFLFLDKDGNPETALHWENHFRWSVAKFNRTHPGRNLKISPHICRHTYCSNMAKTGINPKILQYLMGHSDISVTLNTYTHVKLEDAKKELKKIASGN